MKIQPNTAVCGERHLVKARIGDATNCRKAISEAIAKRAYEMYQEKGSRPGQDRDNWCVAESELVQPLSCMVLKSNEGIVISVFSSVLGPKDVDEVEACIEPHSLILAGKKGEGIAGVRVLPLKEEFDPSSVKLRQNGPYIEIEICKSRVGE
jgi:hypothetical protein